MQVLAIPGWDDLEREAVKAIMIRFDEALSIIEQKVRARSAPEIESILLGEASGRILAEDIIADRDFPPFHRATRDGIAVRASDLVAVPRALKLVGEAPAGKPFQGMVEAGECVRIMTGAPLPQGADAVVMVEQTRVKNSQIEVERAVVPCENVVRQGSEARQGSRMLEAGRRLAPGEIALLASVGKHHFNVFRKPRVAVLATGDEVVPIESSPESFQIRNSNSAMLAACVERAGGDPQVLGIVQDAKTELRKRIEDGLKCSLLITCGGVSVGQYDLVKSVFTDLGAEFYFHGVAIRPGKPLLFGRTRDTFFLGLPGNPVSSFVTFELFVRPVIGILAGARFERPLFLRARLGSPARHKPSLAAFLPARVEWESHCAVVNPIFWQGSGDLVALAHANCFVVLHDDQGDLATGDWVDVLPA